MTLTFLFVEKVKISALPENRQGVQPVAGHHRAFSLDSFDYPEINEMRILALYLNI